jgi:hypothetical protein
MGCIFFMADPIKWGDNGNIPFGKFNGWRLLANWKISMFKNRKSAFVSSTKRPKGFNINTGRTCTNWESLSRDQHTAGKETSYPGWKRPGESSTRFPAALRGSVNENAFK